MGVDLFDRSAARINQLAAHGLDVASFWRACSEVLTSAVPGYSEPCWFTFDPASLLVTSHFDPAVPEVSPDFLAYEYGQDDVWKMADVARSGRRTATVHEVTGGQPEQSECWRRFVAAYGADQELMVPLRSRAGVAWGTLSLFREPGQPTFAPEERDFLATVAGSLAEGARRGLLMGESMDRESPVSPCLIVLDEDLSVESMTPGAEAILRRLPGGGPAGLPSAIASVASRAMSTPATPRSPGEVAVARIRDEAHAWLTIHGAPMLQDGRRRIAVIIEQTDPDRLAPLLMDLYDLTDREKDVAQLVLQGWSTSEIASQLVVSPQTVQQHLKHIFEKTGVSSRREVVGRIFGAHYEPRLRDNERRTAQAKSIRGGPLR